MKLGAEKAGVRSKITPVLDVCRHIPNPRLLLVAGFCDSR
jgi:hypothetical protein